MGIKGFYGYCNRKIKDCHKTVSIIEEIERFKSEQGHAPTLVINLWTLSYQFKVSKRDLLCGYQLNKIKHIFEEFLTKLAAAGCNLIFIIKKTSSDDREFLRRRLSDYDSACKLLKQIRRVRWFDKLCSKPCRHGDAPYNVLILVAMIQTAEKFGKIRGANSVYCKPSVAQAQFATESNATWILGLDTYFFFLEGKWKIWSDDSLNMEKMTVIEMDKEIIVKHFEMNYAQMQMMAILSGDLDAPFKIRTKFIDHFGTMTRFENLAKFVKGLEIPATDETLDVIATKILGKGYDTTVIDSLKSAIASYQNNPEATSKVDGSILEIIRDDFMSFAEELLLNETPIFISPVFLDMQAKDMLDFNTLVMPWISKTAGILLKNVEDKSPRKVVMLQKKRDNFHFVETPLEVTYPDFDVPDLKTLLSGEMATSEKEKMLYWIISTELSDSEWPAIPSNYLVDCLILIYLIKQNSLSVLDARCILQTLVDSRNNDNLTLPISNEYPKKIDSRALRCTFLYQKSYFILHSCLACLGMKNLCPEMRFDGVYFQKMYALNVLNDDGDKGSQDEGEEIFYDAETGDEPKDEIVEEIIPDDADRDQKSIVGLFEEIIRWASK